jgi:ketosteroid isomerase-like protein
MIRPIQALLVVCACASPLVTSALEQSQDDADARTLAALDSEYQRAVKDNDAVTMGRILAPGFVLVTGQGKSFSREDLLSEARHKSTTYEHQEDSNRTVRVFGNTAVVTALLWAKGVSDGKTFDLKLWFSDVYVRTRDGWRYIFGQASLKLPN